VILLKCVDGGGLLQDLVPNYDCMTSKPRLLPFAAFGEGRKFVPKLYGILVAP